MDSEKAKERELIIDEAAYWFVTNRDVAPELWSREFLAWLRRSPAHVREYLGVCAVARDLPSTRPEPDLEKLVDVVLRLASDRPDAQRRRRSER